MTNFYRTTLKRRHSLAFGHKPWRLLAATLMFSLAATGCANRKSASPTPANPADAPVERRGDWFCQPAVPGAKDPWECVQDKGLATNPKPDRLPDADGTQLEKLPLRSRRDRDQPTPDDQINDSDMPLPDQPPAPPGLASMQGTDPPGSTRSTTPVPAQPPPPNPVTSSPITPNPITPIQAPTAPQSPPAKPNQARPQPDYIRLAFQPPQPVSILDLPSNYYAVQLAALSSAKDVETFVAKHELNSLTAAKVAVNGKIRYVLILGIYDSREKAELAAAGQRPAPLAEFTPWIRKLANLQKAMLAAEPDNQP